LKVLLPDGRHFWGRTLGFWSQLAATGLPAYWAKGKAHLLAIWVRNDFIATEADHPLISDIVNRARPGQGRYVALSVEFDPEIIVTLKAWTAKLRGDR